MRCNRAFKVLEPDSRCLFAVTTCGLRVLSTKPVFDYLFYCLQQIMNRAPLCRSQFELTGMLVRHKQKQHRINVTTCETLRTQRSSSIQRHITIRANPHAIFIWSAFQVHPGVMVQDIHWNQDKNKNKGTKINLQGEEDGEQGVKKKKKVDRGTLPACCGGNLAANKLHKPSSWLCCHGRVVKPSISSSLPVSLLPHVDRNYAPQDISEHS